MCDQKAIRQTAKRTTANERRKKTKKGRKNALSFTWTEAPIQIKEKRPVGPRFYQLRISSLWECLRAFITTAMAIVRKIFWANKLSWRSQASIFLSLFCPSSSSSSWSTLFCLDAQCFLPSQFYLRLVRSRHTFSIHTNRFCSSFFVTFVFFIHWIIHSLVWRAVWPL